MGMQAEHALENKRIAFLATNGVEQCELTQPWKAIEDAGGQPVLVSPEKGQIQGVNHDEKADKFDVDVHIDDADPDDFAGLVLPGGVLNPDTLRTCAHSVRFVRNMFKQHKPVAAICHGPVLLIEARVCDGRKLTSYRSIKTDLINAGAEWVDEEVVCDQGLVTSRNPDDLDAFCAKAVEEFAEGKHAMQTA